MRAARISLTVVALVACGWFALDIRQAHDLNAATSIVTGGPVSHAQAARAASLLSAAGALNPDSLVKLAQARLAQSQGHHSRAMALAEQVIRSEPDNPVAWDALAQVSGGNKTVLLNAFRHFRELVPPVAHVR